MRVLLIEDDSATAQSIELMLKSENFNVYTTDLGEEGIDLGKLYDYDIIILDLMLPDMDGFEVCQALRDHNLTKHIPIIFLTAGVADMQRRFRGYEAGAVDFIQKPIEPDILRSKATVFFDLYQQRRLVQAQRDELVVHLQHRCRQLATRQGDRLHGRKRRRVDAHDRARVASQRSPHRAVDRARHHRIEAAGEALVLRRIGRLVVDNEQLRHSASVAQTVV